MSCLTEKKDGPPKTTPWIFGEGVNDARAWMWTASSSRWRPPMSPVTERARLKKNGWGTDASRELGEDFENRVTPTPAPMLRQSETPAEMFSAGPESTV